jgi:hypothetical protein
VQRSGSLGLVEKQSEGMGMFSAIRRRFTYSNVAMTVALVFAMSGGAYAASKYVITSTKQISPKVLKSLKGANGKNGAPGAVGLAGPAGVAGKEGPVGKEGAAGKDGVAGASGKDGVSVTSSAEPKGSNCKEGGSKFIAASGSTYACNGEKGAPGKNGTFGSEPLPQGKTLTGVYSASGFGEEPPKESLIFASVSFPIPVPAELGKSEPAIHYIMPGVGPATGTGDITNQSMEIANVATSSGNFTVGATISGEGILPETLITKVEGETLLISTPVSFSEPEPKAKPETKTGVTLAAGLPAGCMGNASEPGATEGNLCIFAEAELNSTKSGAFLVGPSTGPFGFRVSYSSVAKGFILQAGTWAVTAR